MRPRRRHGFHIEIFNYALCESRRQGTGSVMRRLAESDSESEAPTRLR
jgi:hypothetical protein